MDTHMPRWEPLVGVLFGVLFLAGGLLTNAVPYSAAASETARVFEDNAGRMAAGGTLVMLSAAPLLWFVGCLRSRLRTDGDDGRLAGIVVTAGGACAAVVLVSAASLVGTVSRTSFAESIEPAGAAAAWDLYGTLLGAALPVVMAVLIGATVVSARRSGWFAPAAVWLSGVLVVGLLVLPVAWMFAGAALLWVAAVSISMTRRPRTVGTATTRPRTA